MKKTMILLLIISILSAGCSTPKESTETTPSQTESTAPTLESVVETAEVQPLPVTLDINQLSDCTVSVSLEEGDFFRDENGTLQMDVTVYTYDLYDMVDIAMLQPGSSIVIQQNNVTVESVEQEANLIRINGGLDNGGYELTTDESGVFYEIGYSDIKSWYSIGEITLPVSPNFIYTDSSDLDSAPIEYSTEDFLSAEPKIDYYFIPNNTSILIEGGVITAMSRIYTP